MANTNKSSNSRRQMPTNQQRVLEAIATAMLRKARYFPRKDRASGPVEAEQCGVHGLRPTWHGRAS